LPFSLPAWALAHVPNSLPDRRHGWKRSGPGRIQARWREGRLWNGAPLSACSRSSWCGETPGSRSHSTRVTAWWAGRIGSLPPLGQIPAHPHQRWPSAGLPRRPSAVSRVTAVRSWSSETAQGRCRANSKWQPDRRRTPVTSGFGGLFAGCSHSRPRPAVFLSRRHPTRT
jgi:hypothetical protein